MHNSRRNEAKVVNIMKNNNNIILLIVYSNKQVIETTVSAHLRYVVHSRVVIEAMLQKRFRSNKRKILFTEVRVQVPHYQSE